MKPLTIRISEDIKKRLRIKAQQEHRTLSEQIRMDLSEFLLLEDNPDLPLSFIRKTLEAKKEIEEGSGEEYQFGIVK